MLEEMRATERQLYLVGTPSHDQDAIRMRGLDGARRGR